MSGERVDGRSVTAKYLLEAASEVLEKGQAADIDFLRYKVASALSPYGLTVDYSDQTPAPYSEDVSFGSLLREFRLRAGVAQLKLAENSGFSQSFLSQLECSSRFPKSAQHVSRLAEVLNLDDGESVRFFKSAGYSFPPNMNV